MPVGVTRIRHLPVGFDALVEEARASGFDALPRMRLAWQDRSNRFDREGEGLWAATQDGGLVGICGLNVDPYLEDDRIGRLRHLYVAHAARRRGVGRALVAEALAQAPDRFAWVRLRTHDVGAARFYDCLGFAPPPPELAAGATHALPLGGRRT